MFFMDFLASPHPHTQPIVGRLPPPPLFKKSLRAEGTKNLNQKVSLKSFLIERVYTETKTSTGKSSEKNNLEQRCIGVQRIYIRKFLWKTFWWKEYTQKQKHPLGKVQKKWFGTKEYNGKLQSKSMKVVYYYRCRWWSVSKTWLLHNYFWKNLTSFN